MGGVDNADDLNNYDTCRGVGHVRQQVKSLLEVGEAGTTELHVSNCGG